MDLFTPSIVKTDHTKKKCDIPKGDIKKAVYITAHKIDDTEQHIEDLNKKLKPDSAVYYSHKELYKNVKPIVTIQNDGNYVLSNGEYERIDL